MRIWASRPSPRTERSGEGRVASSCAGRAAPHRRRPRDAVGEHVDPQDLRRCERDAHPHERGQEDHQHLGQATCEGVAQEGTNVGVDAPALLHSCTTVRSWSSASTRSAACRATSVPLSPIATPRSARRRAGASLTPSPVMATTSPRACQASTMSTFCSGWCGRRRRSARRGRRARPGGPRHRSPRLRRPRRSPPRRRWLGRSPGGPR